VKKILIVDDSPAEAQLIGSVVESAGFNAVLVRDPAIVEEVASVQRPVVILLDVVMPVRNGFQVCRDLKQHPDCRLIPIILVTSKNSPSDEFWGKQQGADGYVMKPFTKERLLQEIERCARLQQ
jgi:CheY-like chemotaxis protein